MLLAHTPVFGLPGKEIQECGQRLPDETKADPKDTIAHHLCIQSLHAFQGRRGQDHGDLNDHTQEGNAEDVVRRDANEQLVQEAAEKKDARARRIRAPSPMHERGVNVSAHEAIHGLVPRAPIRAHARAVPPLCVELAVAEAHHLGKGVEEGLKDGKEECQPDD